ncbi:MAG: hypothetical protein MI924_29245 [Chloroflexales bacterium]|nr:hypothetical protein [Chloroflexales bacterium]
MTAADAEFWTRAQQAQDKLSILFLEHPDVSLIDIGYALEQGKMTDRIVLRIHVHKRWVQTPPAERVAFPSQIDGIPVVVMAGNYQLEADTGDER